MKKLILHIGYGKTGSSALQSWLAQNQANLRDFGINYAGINASARKHQVSSGNADNLINFLRVKGTTEEKVLRYYFGSFDNAIISSEKLQNLSEGEANLLREFTDSNSISLKVVAFIRNIYDHNYSNYVQAVKRRGLLTSFDDWADDALNAANIEFFYSLDKIIPVHLISYDSNVSNLAQAFAHATDIQYPKLIPMVSTRVNRTLTIAEIVLLQKFNRVAVEHGYEASKFAWMISDDLVNKYPDVPVSPHYFPTIHQEMERMFGQKIEEFNKVSLARFSFELDILGDKKRFASSSEMIFDAIQAHRRVVSVIASRSGQLEMPMLLAMAKEVEQISKYSQCKLHLAAYKAWLLRPFMGIVKLGQSKV